MATEEYFEKSTLFKLKKVIRYIKLYGVKRTYIKIRAQYHMRSKVGFADRRWNNPQCSSLEHPARRVGIIGSGSFAFSNIAYYLAQKNKYFLRGAMDSSSDRARSLAHYFGGEYATTDPNEIIEDPNIDLVFVASNHASHTPYAISAIRAGKHVHIEKPHVVTEQQLRDLTLAMEENPRVKVFLGFNRPKSRHFLRLQTALADECGPMMINWFVAGHSIDNEHWYFKESEGGRILGNLCHWSDLTLNLVGIENAFPCRIVPTSPKDAKSDFVTAIEFDDGSLATITFSAKGHTFEGVREILNVHKGDVLADIKDFKSTSITRGPTNRIFKSWHRDHGHRDNVENTYIGVVQDVTDHQPSRANIIMSAKLFLAVRDAHRKQETIILNGIDSSKLLAVAPA